MERYMVSQQASVSDTLAPPFFRVTLDPIPDEDDPVVAAVLEEMISLAPSRDGFLGLETRRDASGHLLTVAYWRSADAIENWKRAAVRDLRRRFRGLNLERTCAFEVRQIRHRILASLWSKLPLGKMSKAGRAALHLLLIVPSSSIVWTGVEALNHVG